MHQEEHLITPELLEEADAAFRSSFKSEVNYERSISLSLAPQSTSRVNYLGAYRPTETRTTKRTVNSVLAEAFLCRQLGWDILLEDGNNLYKFPELVTVIKGVHDLSEKKFALHIHPLSRPEMASIATHVSALVADLKTVNKGIQRRLMVQQSLTPFISMFSDAKDFDKRIQITLGVGEQLDDLQELHRFIETHAITQVSFIPGVPEQHTYVHHRPSTFYCARWIAETRIAFPHLKILSAIWPDRVAELGLFLRAGINTITAFPALDLFSSEASQILEEECRTSGRTLVGTFTDTRLLDRFSEVKLQDDVKEKLSKYIESIKKAK